MEYNLEYKYLGRSLAVFIVFAYSLKEAKDIARNELIPKYRKKAKFNLINPLEQ